MTAVAMLTHVNVWFDRVIKAVVTSSSGLGGLSRSHICCYVDRHFELLRQTCGGGNIDKDESSGDGCLANLYGT